MTVRAKRCRHEPKPHPWTTDRQRCRRCGAERQLMLQLDRGVYWSRWRLPAKPQPNRKAVRRHGGGV